MKSITNAMLIAAIICYAFLPFYELSFEGSWTGLKYTSETISNIDSILSKLFSLIPFMSCFAGILFNSLKRRVWGLATMVCIAGGLYFYYVASDFTEAANPQMFMLTGLGYGFNIGYGLLIAALVSSAISLVVQRGGKLMR